MAEFASEIEASGCVWLLLCMESRGVGAGFVVHACEYTLAPIQ